MFVPGPIVFGTIFDTTCALWQELECGVRGACIRYKMEEYAILHILSPEIFSQNLSETISKAGCGFEKYPWY